MGCRVLVCLRAMGYAPSSHRTGLHAAWRAAHAGLSGTGRSVQRTTFQSLSLCVCVCVCVPVLAMISGVAGSMMGLSRHAGQSARLANDLPSMGF